MNPFSLDQAFRITSTNGVEAGRTVVRTSDERQCQLPAGPNASGVLGVTLHSQPVRNRLVTVRRAGLARAVAAEALVPGDQLCVADDEGRVGRLSAPTYQVGQVVAHNQLRLRWIGRGSIAPPVSVRIDAASGDTPFSWTFENGDLVLSPETTGGSITQTAASLIAAINNDAELALLVSAANGQGSSGLGTVAAASGPLIETSKTLNGFAVAEETATQAGDLITIYLKP